MKGKTQIVVCLLVFFGCTVTCNQWCGGELIEMTGEVKSPNYPGNYTHNQLCIWKINVPQGNRVLLNITVFQLEKTEFCKYDMLEIRDGHEENSTLIGRFCGNTIPQYIPSTGNKLLLKFKSDSSVSGKGFSISFSGTPSEECGGQLTENTGQLNYVPSVIEAGSIQSCMWRIEAPARNKVVLNITEFKLKSSVNCTDEYLEVYDCGFLQTTLLGRYCGTDIPQEIASTENNICLFLQTSASQVSKGFKMTWDGTKIGCGGDFQNSTGLVQSPYYPEMYPNNRDCIWRISVKPGMTVALHVVNFNLESQSTCNHDYLEVRDGLDGNATLLGKFCGNIIPRFIKSTDNQMFLRFVTDSSVARTGFELHWNETAACGVKYTEDTGIISFNRRHEKIPAPKMTCVWDVEGPRLNKVLLNVTEFELQRSENCEVEYLEIFNGGNFNSPELGRFCGTDIPRFLETSGNKTTLRLVTGTSIASRFQLQWDTTKPLCGAKLSGTNGTIISPNYPNNYLDGQDCVWTITVNPDQQILLDVTDFELEHGDTCRHDYLEIGEGEEPGSNIIGRYCGVKIPKLIWSKTNKIWLKFATDGSDTRRGFTILWEGKSSDCGGSVQDLKGVMRSPNYPNYYPQRHSCVWVITSPNSKQIRLDVTSFQLEESFLCDQDYLEIRDGGDINSTLIGRYCGTRIPSTIWSNGSQMMVAFRSFVNVTNKGFSISYDSTRPICGGEFNGTKGVIQSLKYPAYYPANRNCIWKVTVPTGHKIRLNIQDFQLEDFECSYDNLEIRDGGNADSKLIGKYCGINIPRVITSSDNQIWLRFIADLTVNARGFNISWHSISEAGEEDTPSESLPVSRQEIPDHSHTGYAVVITVLLIICIACSVALAYLYITNSKQEPSVRFSHLEISPEEPRSSNLHKSGQNRSVEMRESQTCLI